MKARRAVDAVAVEQRHGRHAVFRAQAGQFFGQEAPSRKLKAERA